MRQFTRSIAFLLIGALLLFGVQGILTPKNTDRMGYSINGFKALNKDTVDAVFIGSSLMHYGVSPMRIYEDTGLRTYTLASADQQLGLTYGLLEMVFRTQHPKVVLLTATSLFEHNTYTNDEGKVTAMQAADKAVQQNYAVPRISDEKRNNYWYRVFDTLPLGTNKFAIVWEYMKTPYHDTFFTPLFPIIKYHERWKELTSEDFFPTDTGGWYYAAGESNGVGVNPGLTTVEQENSIVNYLIDRNVGYATVFDGKRTHTEKLTEPVYEPVIQQQTADEILKIRQLCEENGAELILTTVPTAYFPLLRLSEWTEIKAKMAKEFAKENNIELVDLKYDYGDIVNFSTDTYDGGGHLNVRGAEKVAVALEPILLAKIPGGGGSDPVYSKMLTQYQKIREVMYLEMETDFEAYIDRLAEKKDQYVIFIAACDDYTQGMTRHDYAFLRQKLGLELLEDGELADAYLAVLDRGERIYEERSDRRITHRMELLDKEITLVSSGTFHNQLASVKMDDQEYALSRAGLNIVVYDRETGLVIDMAAINTQDTEKPVTHGDVTPYFIEYETLMRKERS